MSSQSQGTEYVILSRLEAPSCRLIRYQIRSCLRGGNEDSLYQVLPHLLQPLELHLDGDPDVLGHWLSRWEVEVTHIQKYSPLGHIQMRRQVEDRSLASWYESPQETCNLTQRVFLVVIVFLSVLLPIISVVTL